MVRIDFVKRESFSIDLVGELLGQLYKLFVLFLGNHIATHHVEVANLLEERDDVQLLVQLFLGLIEEELIRRFLHGLAAETPVAESSSNQVLPLGCRLIW